jgi:macrolide efflux pump
VLLTSALAWLLPSAILSPFAGVYVDRWNKKWTMMISDGLVSVFTIIMAIFLMQGGDQLTAIYILMALRSTASAFHGPSMQASMPLLAPQSELMRIASVNQMIQGVSSIAGPALGGALLVLLPISQILFLDVLGAAIAISFLFFVKFPKEEKQKSQNGVKQVLIEMVD